MSNEFKINDFLTLKLEEDKTIIYVKGTIFNQSKYLELSKAKDFEYLLSNGLLLTSKTVELKTIESIDKTIDFLIERELRLGTAERRAGRARMVSRLYTSGIDPKTIFWGHCSNLQVWAENGYNTCLLHSNLAFPLLKALVDVGDSDAKNAFQKEISSRLASGYSNVVIYLLMEGYLSYLNANELESVLDKGMFLKIVSMTTSFDWFGVKVFEILFNAMQNTNLLKENFLILLSEIKDINKERLRAEIILDLIKAIRDTDLLKVNFSVFLNAVMELKNDLDKQYAFEGMMFEILGTNLVKENFSSILRAVEKLERKILCPNCEHDTDIIQEKAEFVCEHCRNVIDERFLLYLI